MTTATLPRLVDDLLWLDNNFSDMLDFARKAAAHWGPGAVFLQGERLENFAAMLRADNVIYLEIDFVERLPQGSSVHPLLGTYDEASEFIAVFCTARDRERHVFDWNPYKVSAKVSVLARFIRETKLVYANENALGALAVKLSAIPAEKSTSTVLLVE